MRISARLFILAVALVSVPPVLAQSSPEASGESAQSTDSAASSGTVEQGGEATSQQSAVSPGQQFVQWLDRAAKAYERQDIEGWVEATEKLHGMRPYNQDFMRHLVEGHARLGNLSQAYDMMLKMQKQGLSEDWDSNPAVEPMREHELYDHLTTLMSEAGEPFGDVSVWSRLGEDYPMPEAMAIDAERDRLFVGTVRDGLILTSEDGEDWNTWLSPEELPELQSVFDLAVDSERGHLWVATGRVPYFQGEEREDEVRSSLLRLDLETGELQREYTVTAGGERNLLGSLAIAQDGTIYVADTRSPVIYRLEPGQEELKPFFAHQNFTSLRGMALNDDDSLLYVADYELGIFIVDVSGAQQAWQLAVPDTFNAGGIDGLFFWNDHLIGIQNAITPQRVVRLQLGDDGLGVTAVAPLAAAREEFDSPTYGVMDGQDLYFLAGSHWQDVDAEGNPKGDLPEVPIMKLDVDNAAVRVVGQEILDELRRQQKERQMQSPEG